MKISKKQVGISILSLCFLCAGAANATTWHQGSKSFDNWSWTDTDFNLNLAGDKNKIQSAVNPSVLDFPRVSRPNLNNRNQGPAILKSSKENQGPWINPVFGGKSGEKGIHTDEHPKRSLQVSPVPVPAAFWLFGTALIGFIGLSRRTKV